MPNYVLDPSTIGAGIGNLGTALFGNPHAVAQAQLMKQQGANYDAEAAAHRAAAGESDAKTAKITAQNTATTQLQQLFGQGVEATPQGGVHLKPEAVGRLMGAAAAASNNPGAYDPSKMMGLAGIFSGNPDSMRAGNIAMHGAAGMNPNFSPTGAEGDRIRQANEANAMSLEQAKLHNVPPDNSVVTGASLQNQVDPANEMGGGGGLGALFNAPPKQPMVGQFGNEPQTVTKDGTTYHLHPQHGWVPVPGQKSDYTKTEVKQGFDPSTGKPGPVTNVTSYARSPGGASTPAKAAKPPAPPGAKFFQNGVYYDANHNPLK